MVELHEGQVEAHSDGIGHGSEFVVRLPLIPEPKSQDLIAAPRPAAEPLCVVLVEDNDDTRTMLTKLLEIEGHEVVQASNGRDGVKAILNRQPDVALVDIGLPEIDGYELARQVRALHDGQTMLVAVTGLARILARAREATSKISMRHASA